MTNPKTEAEAPGSGSNDGFNYVNVVYPEDCGWLNLFFGDSPLVLVNNRTMADAIRARVPMRNLSAPNTGDQR